MASRVATSNLFDNKSWRVSSGIFAKASSVGAKRVMGPAEKINVVLDFVYLVIFHLFHL